MIAAVVTVLVLIILFFVWVVIENHIFCVTDYRFPSNKLSAPIKVAHISDLHNISFGTRNSGLINKLVQQQPDLIVFSGDTIDSEETENSLTLIRACAKIAPTYLTIGNHEADLPQPFFESFVAECRTAGAVFLTDETVSLTLRGQAVNLIGLSDPNYYATTNKGEALRTKAAMLAEGLDNDRFNLMVTHRPEYFDIYTSLPFDLSLAGHAHGGQWRLFGLGAYATAQGLFPKYTKGFYNNGERSMLVSRGLGNGKWIPRIFNIPELLIITLAPKD